MMYAGQLGLLEAGLNRILRADPDSAARLAGLSGRTLRIDSWLHEDVSVYLTFHEEGIRLDSEFEGTPAATLAGGPVSLLRSALNPGDRRVFSDGTLQVSGDAALVQGFADLFRLYRSDWQRHLSPIIGEALTWRIESMVDELRAWRGDVSEKMAADSGDYLREELRLLAGREAVEDFSNQVDDLASDMARLQRRIERIEENLP
jgi:ubiquinone biosynthesis accessory factor UbiJ